MKILINDPNEDLYALRGDISELKQDSGSRIFSTHFTSQSQSVRSSIVLAEDMKFLSDYFYSPVTVTAEVNITNIDNRQNIYYILYIQDDSDRNPRMYAYLPLRVGIHKITLNPDRRDKSSVSGKTQMLLRVSPPSGVNYPAFTRIRISHLKVFVDSGFFHEVKITSVRDVGFHDTTKYLRTVTGRKVVGIPGFQYRTLEVEIARTTYEDFQNLINSLDDRGFDKPFNLQFDDCHSNAYKGFQNKNFKCTLENFAEIMLQGGIRKDFYKTKLKFREWVDKSQ